ncbi:WD40-repeat-containing domain protein [Aspergillus aurantiobrunneus]
MDSSLEHVDACLPVTTLGVFDIDDTRHVLLGQGPFARLIEEESGKVLGYLRAFKRNHIHGFAVLRKEQEARMGHVRLLAWGSQSLRLLDLTYSKYGTFEESALSLVASSAEYLAPDWVLAGCAPSTTDDGNAAYLVTAHNAVLGMSVIHNSSSEYGRIIHVRQIVVGVKSILYSAQIITVSSSNLLVAAGTVFGEIIVWSCFIRCNQGSDADAVNSIHHFFTGHEGSIFDVKISPEIANLHGELPGRLLASCSDDRTVRIWDVSDYQHASPDKPAAYSTDGFELRCTGFGQVKDDKELHSESCIISAFGHGARIWGVDFLAEQPGEGKIGLVSRGEDAQCLVWNLSWEPSLSQKPQFKLTNTCSLRPHSGKHIWSLQMCTTGAETIVYTGGNDGAVRSFKLVQEAEELVCPNRTTRIAISLDSEGTKYGIDTGLRAFGFVSPDCVLTTTTAGEVQIRWAELPYSIDRRIARGTLFVEEDLSSYSIVAALPYRGIALIGNKHGLIRLYDHEARSLNSVVAVGQRPVGLHALGYQSNASDSCAVVSFIATYLNPVTADLFHIHLSPDTKPRVDKVVLHVPQGFEIACASLINNDDYLAIGSKYGSLAVYKMKTTGSLQSLLKVSRIHSKDGVSNIIPFTSLSHNTASTYFLTCGRDGNYRVNVLNISKGSEDVSLRTVHSPTALGFKIEGAYIDDSSQCLMFYGFGGMSFVLWNESTQCEVARIHCGGGHRRWAFHPSRERLGEGLFLWQQGGLNASYINTHAAHSICAGGHGREIKSLGTFQPADGKGPLLVTGSEDTTLRVFTPQSPHGRGPWGALECIRVLTAHDSGPQHITWSKDGGFLFTSSAMEDFFVWKIRSIPLFGFAAAIQGWCPKSHPNSELRVTCFDILEVENGQAEASFLLCLTYSNSTIKVFHLSCVDEDGYFTLLASGTYTSNCLTQVRFLQTTSSLYLITTSTDGHFTLWDLTAVLEPFYILGPPLCLKQPLGSISVPDENITCDSRHQIHSNSIKVIDVVEVTATTTLMIAGGDDNAVTLSLLHTEIKNGETSSRAATISVPDAHTASVNAVKIIEQSIAKSDGAIQLSFASSGNDHRVKLWQVTLAMHDRPTLDGMQVQNVLDRYSPVADISSLDVFLDGEETKLLVCGVGMELFTVEL